MYFKSLREFRGLLENEKPTYLINHGNKLILNIVTFGSMPHSGTVMRGYGITLVGLLAAKDDSEIAHNAYEDHLNICLDAMESNYNDIDLVAAGDADVIALAGVKSSSDNTARVGVPGNFVDLKYTMTNFGNKIKVEWFYDEMAYGTITITSADMAATFEQSGPSQLKLTVGSSVFFIDVTTKSYVLVEHLPGGSLVKTRAVKFNTNGMNPMVTMSPVMVPVTT